MASMRILFLHGGSWYDAKGGSEKQLELLERNSSKHGHEVVHVSFKSINNELPMLSKNSYSSLYSFNSSIGLIKRLRLFHKLLKEFSPHIIYTRSFRYIPLAFLVKVAFRIPIVYNISSTLHCLPLFDRLQGTKGHHRIKLLNSLTLIQSITHFLLPHIDKIIAQTVHQKMLLQEHFNVESTVLRNGHVVQDGHFSEKEAPILVTWIGNIKRLKRPELFIELARYCKDIDAEFIMCGRQAKDSYQNRIDKLIEDTPNLQYMGEMSFDSTNLLLERSSVLVSTSEAIEGFPNTYIQAWMHNTPVVTLSYDPDNIITQYGLGFHSGTFKQLVNDVQTLISDSELCFEMGERAREYSLKNHDISRIISMYLAIFKSLTSDGNLEK